MCGLTGILCSTPRDSIIDQLYKMTSSLIHRGPDDEDVWSEGCIGLGHRRLSILDLSSLGRQPMRSHCGRYVIVYNGEIYNHFEIRNALEKSGSTTKWRGRSDTETILEAIVQWGIDDALDRSKGMFALALWDKKKKSLSLARDRVGEKPLYWGWAGKDIIFGSELKALRAHSYCASEVCHKALSQYLRFMYIPAPRSIYPNIYKLEPGTILTILESPPTIPPKNPIRPGEKYESISIRQYWNLNEQIQNGATNLIKDEHEAISLTEQTLKKAVKSQMISDVPLGAFLSGGVDSSTIVAMMQSQSNKPINTFTIGFSESNYDESSKAEAVSAHLGTIHNKLYVTDNDARDVIPDLPWLYDEPFADSSQIPTHLVCRSAKKNVTVALSGDGGDEMFGGYNRYIYGPKLWKRISHLPIPLRRALRSVAQKMPDYFWDRFESIYNKIKSKSSGISSLGKKVNRISEQIVDMKTFEDFNKNIVSNWHEPNNILVNSVTEPNSHFEDTLPNGIVDLSMLMIFQDIRSYLPDDILCKVDRAGMGINLETRTPFLDPDVISLSTRIPISMKIRKNQGKWALRQVLYKYVPQEIIDNPKKGFEIPIGLWLRGPLRDWAGDLLSTQRLKLDGYFKHEIVNQNWNDHLSKRKDLTNRIWSILMFQSWMDKWQN